jgi:hypothetical protein
MKTRQRFYPPTVFFEFVLFLLSRALFASFCFVFFVNSFLAAENDFSVFWKAGRNFLDGLPLYDLQRDGTHCFKYPPWIVPLFLPFSVLPARMADVCWRLFAFFCMLWICHWTLQRSRRPSVVLLVFVGFWGIWMNNLISGQITSILLAIALFGCTQGVLVFFSLSAKVFYLISLFGLKWAFLRKLFWNRKSLLSIALLVIVPTLLALRGYGGSLATLLEKFSDTSGSDGAILSGGNYGLPAFWIQILSLSNSTPHRVFGFLISAVILFPLLRIFQFNFRRFDSQLDTEWFTLCLAVGAVIHPLQFSYGFAWVFPFSVFALERALDFPGKSRFWFVSSALFALLGILILDRLGLSFFKVLPIRSLSVLSLVGIWVILVAKKGYLTH